MTLDRVEWIVAKAELAEERLTPWERQEETLEKIAEKCA